MHQGTFLRLRAQRQSKFLFSYSYRFRPSEYKISISSKRTQSNIKSKQTVDTKRGSTSSYKLTSRNHTKEAREEIKSTKDLKQTRRPFIPRYYLKNTQPVSKEIKHNISHQKFEKQMKDKQRSGQKLTDKENIDMNKVHHSKDKIDLQITNTLTERTASSKHSVSPHTVRQTFAASQATPLFNQTMTKRQLNGLKTNRDLECVNDHAHSKNITPKPSRPKLDIMTKP